MEDTRFQPLADKMRPSTLNEIVGQTHLLAKGKPLAQAIENGHVHSMVLWGAPGTGKTTLAKMIAQSSQAHFVSLSAVLSGVKDIRDAVAHAKAAQSHTQLAKPTIIFVDEVHRFNKAQQDAFLPHIEDGTIVFIGATTENPSFELNNALLSRVRVYVLKPLKVEHLQCLIQRAIEKINANKAAKNICIDEKAVQYLAQISDGDARRALNTLEICIDFSEGVIDMPVLQYVLQESHTRQFDKGGDIFYEQISALHKSVRGSSADAALYWLCRMLDGGCDPLYIARRLVRIASEDIGNADPRALQIALNAWEVQERLGSPEGELTLAQAVLYLAVAAKSNASYTAFKDCMRSIQETGSLDVPMHLRNAPSSLMKRMGYAKDYQYAHDYENAYAPNVQYLPDALKEHTFYRPVDRGLEIQIKQKMDALKQQDAANQRSNKK